MTDPRRVRLQERRDRALADIVDLEGQVDAGEIGADEAARLRARYRAEVADALAALDRLDGGAPTRSARRTWMGLGIFAVVALLAVLGIARAVKPRAEGGFITGGISTPTTIDLSRISNEEMEEVVAANPDVLPMRLALGRRYIEDGDFSAALPHYMYVLERGPNAEALMYVGWMTYLSGDAETGAALLERSLDVSPGEPLAQWFLANARFHGLGDRAGAVPLLEAVLGSEEAPPEVVAEAEAMLAEAESEGS